MRSRPTVPTVCAVPPLRFNPTAWAKLLFLRDLGETEVGGFGITRADDLLYVEDVQLVRQTASEVTVAFDDEAVADFFDQQVDRGLRPEQFARVWVHSHPGDSPYPSAVDEDTFTHVFGRSDWSVMFILAQGGKHYARLQFSVGPGGSLEIPVEVDFTQPFAASDCDAWEDEYASCVQPEPLLVSRNLLDPFERPLDRDDYPVAQEFEALDEAECGWPSWAGLVDEL
jgi:proteasome lid subunit RPN8/RPN11